MTIITQAVPDPVAEDPPRQRHPQDLAHLDDYVRTCARTMLVGDWKLDFPRVVCDDESFATVTLYRSKRGAAIRFCADFGSRSLADQRQTIVHELVHLHLADLEEAFDSVSPRLSSDVYQVAWSVFDRAQEIATDQLARVIADALPLPPVMPRSATTDEEAA